MDVSEVSEAKVGPSPCSCSCAAWERPKACERESLLFYAAQTQACADYQLAAHKARPADRTALMLHTMYQEQAEQLRAKAEALKS